LTVSRGSGSSRTPAENAMNKIPLFFLIPLALGLPVAGAAGTECLSVTSNTWTRQGSEFGITYVLWEAELSNECAASYDADLVIRFVDGDGKTIYQSLDLVTVPRRATATTSREFNIPDHDFDRLADVVVTIKEERERPF
jgi:hypothetical protein